MRSLPGSRALALLLWVGVTVTPLQAAAQQTIVSGMTWMTQYPSTWNSATPKLVSDGLHFYAVFCGTNGSAQNCSIARKRGDGIEDWTFGSRTFQSQQPAGVVIDRKGRLNIFYNDPQLHHLRIDHPSVDLSTWLEVPVNFSNPVGYLHASYDSSVDLILLGFADTTNWRPYLGVKFTDMNGWMMSPLPAAASGTLLLYARALRANDRYFMLLGEHVIDGPNAYYTAAVLFESPTPSGPWTRTDIHRVTGNNLGVPYQNWVLANDLQANSDGQVRALLHITESGSGHLDPLDGLYILRQEDGYAPRLIGAGVEDGFSLYIDPDGTHLAFARHQVQTAPFTFAGGIVWYRSDDDGVTWQKTASGFARELNPTLVHAGTGSMLGTSARYLSSGENASGSIFDRVLFNGVALGLPLTSERYDYEYQGSDGMWDYVRAYRDRAGDRSYYYIYDYRPDWSFTVTYSYTAGSYYQVYIAESTGAYRYYNSDGYQVRYEAPSIVQYWYDDPEDGARNYIYIYRDSPAETLWWVVYDFNPAGGFDLTYVYYRGSYYYIEFRYADGHVLRYDSTGFFESS